MRRDDIPLSCPMPGMYLWNSHPRVYLPIEETGEAKCPYCGAQYVLEDEAAQSDNWPSQVTKAAIEFLSSSKIQNIAIFAICSSNNRTFF